MNVYLAARYSRRDEMREFARKLESQGHRITSRWLMIHTRPDSGKLPDGRSRIAPPEDREAFAVQDIEDVDAADCLIHFTEPEDAKPSRGGRHVEFGYALGKLKRVIVVGHQENVFCHLPDVEFFETAGQALKELGYEAP